MSHEATRQSEWVSRFRVWKRSAILGTLLPVLGGGPSPGDSSALLESVAPCVPCHSRDARDQVGEWLASPYSEPEGGRGCTDCHGRYCSGNSTPRTIVADREVVDPRGPRYAASLSVTAVCSGGAVEAEVAVSNVGAGHLLPTGPEWRTLFLEVTARDGNEASLALRGGGAALRSRLAPFATDVSRYRFDLPESGRAHVHARLLQARAAGPPREVASTTTVCSTREQTR